MGATPLAAPRMKLPTIQTSPARCQPDPASLSWGITTNDNDRLLLSWDATGLWRCEFVDDNTALPTQGHHDDKRADHWLHDIQCWNHTGQAPASLQLHLAGTDWQLQLWQHLLAIPCGETRSYQTLANELASPRHARAVAHACASNTLALAIPCHRVIGSNGELSGYRWGISRKQGLLAQEAVATR